MSTDQALIEILLDPIASIAERDDAAMDLSAHDSPEVRAALLQIARSEQEHEVLQASAGETLGEFWEATGEFDQTLIDSLTPMARSELLGRTGRR